MNPYAGSLFMVVAVAGCLGSPAFEPFDVDAVAAATCPTRDVVLFDVEASTGVEGAMEGKEAAVLESEARSYRVKTWTEGPVVAQQGSVDIVTAAGDVLFAHSFHGVAVVPADGHANVKQGGGGPLEAGGVTARWAATGYVHGLRVEMTVEACDTPRP